MATFNRKAKSSQKFQVKIDGELSFYVVIEKMSVPDMLELTNKSFALQEDIKNLKTKTLTKEIYDSVLNDTIDLIVGLEGVEDDGVPTVWSNLSYEDKYDLVKMIDLDSIFEVWGNAITVGRLSNDEKKV